MNGWGEDLCKQNGGLVGKSISGYLFKGNCVWKDNWSDKQLF